MRTSINCLCFVLGAIATTTVYSQSYDFEFDEKVSEISQTSSIRVPFSGTLKGNYDEETNPEGTRTLAGLFGGGPNDEIGYDAAFGLEGSNTSTPSGSFTLDVDSANLIAVMSGLQVDVFGEETGLLNATLNLVFETFRTSNPDSLYVGGIELPIPLGEVEIRSLLMAQSADASLVLVPGSGDTLTTISGVVPVDLTFDLEVFGQEIGGVPMPMLLPINGTLIENDNGAQVAIGVNIEVDDVIPSAGIPLDNIPVEMPTIIPPGNVASVLFSGTDSEGSIAGTWDLQLVADADSESCAGDPDINGDGVVNGADLTIILASWGAPGGPADVNCDGIIDGQDLTIVLADWTF